MPQDEVFTHHEPIRTHGQCKILQQRDYSALNFPPDFTLTADTTTTPRTMTHTFFGSLPRTGTTA
jgi:hypothetical protein